MVSIIIPCYNYGSYLREAIDSISQQTYFEWECIIVDNGSTDNTSQIAMQAAKVDKRFQYLYQAKNSISAARNKGIEAARGEYIQFLDADDMLATAKIELQVAFLETSPEVDIIYSDVRFFDNENRSHLAVNYNMTDEEWMPKVSGPGEAVLRHLVAGNIMVMNAPLIRARLVAKVQGFDTSLKVMEDWYFWIACALAGACFHYDGRPAAYALVRTHRSSISKNRMQMYVYEGLIRRRYLAASPDAVVRQLNAEKLTRLNEYLAVSFAEHKQPVKSALYFLYAARSSRAYTYYLKSSFLWLRKALS